MSTATAKSMVIRTLEKLGVEVIYGIPGIHNLPIYEALLDSSIRHITTRHEQGAGFAADGQARATGRPGVALVISGPGLTNVLTPMGQAFHDSIPMLVLSTTVPSHLLQTRSGFLHELRESNAMVRSVAKESFRISDPAEIPATLTRAYELCQSGRPGPVHVEFPMDLLEHITDSSDVPDFGRTFSSPMCDGKSMAVAAEILGSAARPVVIAGGGCRHAARELAYLAEGLGAPVITTCAAKGLLPESHPLSLGTRIHSQAVRDVLLQADAILAVGTELSPTDLWEFPLTISGKLVRIDLDPHHRIHPLPADCFILGDAAVALREIGNALPASARPLWIAEGLEPLRLRCREELPATTGIGAGTPDVIAFVQALRRGLPDETRLFADMTTAAYVALSEFSVEGPGRFIHPVGFGTLGLALPAAIGAMALEPQVPTAVLAGDGGFQFTLPELAVAVQEKMSLPIVVFNDGGFGEISRNEELRHPGRKIAVAHENPDFAALARAYGAGSAVAVHPEDLVQALQDARKAPGPYLIEYRVSR